MKTIKAFLLLLVVLSIAVLYVFECRAGVSITIDSTPYYVEFFANGTVSALRREVSRVPTERSLIVNTLDQVDIVDKARQFVDAHPELFKVASADLHLIAAQQVENQWIVVFLQLYKGVVVYDSQVELHLDENGEVLSAATRSLFTDSTDTDSMVTKKEAVTLSLNRCDELEDCSRSGNPLIKGYLTLFPYEPTDGEREFRLAWYLNFKQRDFFVDAVTGEILADMTNIIFANVTGTVEGKHTDWGRVPSSPPIQEKLQNLRLRLAETAGVIVIPIFAARDSQPVISGNGEVVVFVSDIDGDKEIYAVNFDGSNLVKLTNNTVDDDQPDISDDGSLVVFVSRVEGEERLFRINANGSGLAPLTIAGTGNNRNPSLSGDGTGIAFVSDRSGNEEVYFIHSDGSGEMPLTANGFTNRHPSITDNGAIVSFSSNLDGGFELFTIVSTGAGLEQVTFNTADTDAPSISDAGDGIAFTSANGGNNDIYLTQLDPLFGWVLGQLSADLQDDIQPDLSGDGSKVAFASDRLGDFEVFTINGDGSDEARLTFDPGTDWRPSISDDGTRVVFASESNAIATIRIVRIPVVTKSTLTLPDIPSFLSINPLDTVVDLPGGTYSLLCPDKGTARLYTTLAGKNVTVQNLGGANMGLAQAACPPLAVDFLFNQAGAPDLNNAQVNAYYHTDALYSYLDNILGAPRTPVPNPLKHILATVNGGGTQCNADYNPGLETINFYRAGGGCPNTAYDSIIFHEYGHFLDDSFFGIGAGNPGRGLSEGIADMTALFATGFAGNPALGIVGEDFKGGGKHLRDYRVGGDWHDRQLESLNTAGGGWYVQGGAFAGFAWQSRARLLANLGAGGINEAEDIFFSSLFFNRKDVRAAAIQVFYTDDMRFTGGDEQIKNETPNYHALRLSACQHNLDAVPYPESPWGEISFDFGDAPEPYPTKGASGARHATIDCERLGAAVSRETSPEDNDFDEDGINNLAPMDRDADDGVVFKSPLLPNKTINLDVTVSIAPALLGTGRYVKDLPNHRIYLNAWADWNGDGKWSPADNEKIIGTDSPTMTWYLDPNDNDPIHGFGGKTSKTTNFNQAVVSEKLTDKPFAVRFRLDFGEDAGNIRTNFSNPSLKQTEGWARYGEVEDYLVCVDLATGNVATKVGSRLAAQLDLLRNRPQGTDILFSDQARHAFFGSSPPVAGSRAVLMINEDNNSVRFTSEDFILGVVDTGASPQHPALWTESGTNPLRIVFTHRFMQDGKAMLIQGNVLLPPYNRAVVDVVNQTTGKRVRYLLMGCYQMAVD